MKVFQLYEVANDSSVSTNGRKYCTVEQLKNLVNDTIFSVTGSVKGNSKAIFNPLIFSDGRFHPATFFTNFFSRTNNQLSNIDMIMYVKATDDILKFLNNHKIPYSLCCPKKGLQKTYIQLICFPLAKAAILNTKGLVVLKNQFEVRFKSLELAGQVAVKTENLMTFDQSGFKTSDKPLFDTTRTRKYTQMEGHGQTMSVLTKNAYAYTKTSFSLTNMQRAYLAMEMNRTGHNMGQVLRNLINADIYKNCEVKEIDKPIF